MSLAPGVRLGAYEIVSLLGAGGMGEVYRARDTRLRREVAIKILPDAFAHDPDRLSRFQREAELLATLNHPNIGAIFGLEQLADSRAIVLELIEGETLANVIQRGAVPVEKALPIARQIAEALEAAHERGVVHRDLKPANIKITPDDKVKVLDFGLAKALETAPGAGSLSHSPTLSMMATQAGVVLGTAAYMSPEQAKGFPADQRSDIFAFGTVLYEMLVGKQPFQGDTAPDILASVLVRDPDLTLLPPNLNPRIAELLQRCLEKNPKKRWQAIGDVRAEIERITPAPRSAPVSTSALRRPLWQRAAAAAIAAIFGAAVAGLAVWNFKPSPPQPTSRFAYTLPDGQEFSNAGRPVVAISPDGASLVYVSNRQLFLRSMSELEAKPIAGIDALLGAINPVFSPDSRSIAFFSIADSTLKRIAVSGGAPVTLAQLDVPFGITWGDDGILLGQSKGIVRVAANGSKPEMVVAAKPGEMLHGPQMLPDKQTMLFTVASLGSADRWNTAQIVVQSLKSGARKTLLKGGSDARYVPTGHLVYALGTVAFAVRFDPKRFEVVGSPTPVIPVVQRALTTGTAQFSFSNTGTLSYIPNRLFDVKGTLVYRSRDGRDVQPITQESSNFPRYPNVSPDGRWLAVTLGEAQNGDIWIYDLRGGRQARKLTFEGHDVFPVWTRDGQRIFYHSIRAGGSGIWSIAADGSESSPKQLALPSAFVNGAGTLRLMQFSPDGLLMFSAPGASMCCRHLILAAVQGNAAPRVWVNNEFNEDEARFSPDGRFVAYASDSTGRSEIWVRPYPGPGAPVRLSLEGGHEPIWSHDGKELFFQSGPRLMAVRILERSPEFRAGPPEQLFTGGFFGWGPTTGRTYDIAADGRLLMVQTAETKQERGQIVVQLNWFEELKQRVPVK